MKRIDLHVDELFDRARTGTLSDADRARLERHCRACVACRVELGWVQDGLHAEAPSCADRQRAASVVETLLGTDHAAAESIPTPGARPRRARWPSVAVVAVGLLTASAAAAVYAGVQAAVERAARQEARTAQAPPLRSAARRRARGTHASASSEAQPTPVAPAAAGSALSAPDVPASAAASRASRPAGPVRSRAQLAESLFVRANAARAAGHYAQALSDYEALAQRFAGTRSALAARISRAELLLRRLGRPADARIAYRDYLAGRPDGALAEQARIGLAESARRLGDDEEEKNAWQELLEHHPDSLHAERARARLRVLAP